MNDYFYMPLPVACLEINRPQLSRAAKRVAKAERKQREYNTDNGWGGHVPGTGPLARKRRAKPFGKHNKDKYHK